MRLEIERDRIESVLRAAPGLHLYALGDLDDFFFPSTSFFVSDDDEPHREVALLYRGSEPPTLLALSSRPPERLRALLDQTMHEMPEVFYGHLSPGLQELLEDRYRVDRRGRHLKMLLRDDSRARSAATGEARLLSATDENELRTFYADAYPDNWFVPRMLETGHYVGIDHEGRLAAVAGVHVFSARYRVAALGNVATLPGMRGRGLARRACAHLIERLMVECDHVGLNVEEKNRAAVRCYESLGFEVIARYDEALLERRSP